MKKSTLLRLVGGVVLLFNLWLIGAYELKGVSTLLLTFGFAAGYELLLVRAVIRSESAGSAVPMPQPVHQVPVESLQLPGAPQQAKVGQEIRVESFDATSPREPLASAHSANLTAKPPANPVGIESDEALWAAALEEVDGNGRKPGLWAKAYASSRGDQAEAKAWYLNERVKQLAEEASVRKVQELAEQAAAAFMRSENSQDVSARIDQLKALFLAGRSLTSEQIAFLARASETDESLSLLSERFSGETLLHWCARYGLVAEASILLKAGANPTAANGNGQKAYALATEVHLKQMLLAAVGEAGA